MASDIEKVIGQFSKKFPNAFIDVENQDDYGAISTGSIPIDRVTMCGGFPRGRMTEISGDEGGGKTTVVAAAVARCIERGDYPAYLDAESALDLDYV